MVPRPLNAIGLILRYSGEVACASAHFAAGPCFTGRTPTFADELLAVKDAAADRNPAGCGLSKT